MFVNGNLPTDEGAGNDRTSIYFLSYDSPTAVKLLYAIDPEHPQDIDGICSYPMPIKPATNELNHYVGWYGCIFNPEGQSVVRLTDTKPTFFAQ